MENRAVVESVARSKGLHFYWVSGHKVIEVNEILNEIAKSGNPDDCRKCQKQGTREIMEH